MSQLKLNNHDLNIKLKSLAAEERSLTKVILEHICEVDRRKLYLDLSYPSLYSYLTEEIGYSEGAAQRRIDTARLIRKLPDVASKIESGDLKLVQVSKLQKACRLIKKETGKAISLEKQKEILLAVENEGAKKTDLILAQELNFTVQIKDIEKTQKDESVRVELTFSKEEMEIIRQAQALLSHKTGGNLKSSILEMAKAVVEKFEKGKVTKNRVSVMNGTIAVNGGSSANGVMAVNGTDAVASAATVAVKPLKSVTPKMRKFILKRDQFCQFKDHQTGRVCGSKFYLEVDHIKPRFVGGESAPQNLRVLCKNHNQFRYQVGR